MNLEHVRQIEAVAARAWPPLTTQALSGWVLRHSDGVTRRANSVYSVAWEDDVALEVALRAVESFYRTRGLRPRFQISPAALPGGLDDTLAARGYRLTARTAVQTVPLGEVAQRLAGIGSWRIAVAGAPDPAWLDVYAGAEGADGRSLAVRRAIMAAIPDRACYAVAYDAAGQPAAVGSAIAADGYLGFFNVATVPTQRRRGAARAVMAALLDWGAAAGAVEAYLQVMVDNAPGLALYASLGFETCYHYHYRETQLTNGRRPRSGNGGR